MCQKNHDLDACFKYKQLQVDERKKFLVTNKLCFDCYNIISKEGRNCLKRRKCSICKELHPIGLQGLQPKKRSPEKEDDNYTPPMPPGNEEKRDSVKACASAVAQTSTCVCKIKRFKLYL